MAPSTEIATVEPGGFLALNHDLTEIQEAIEANLGGQEVTEFDLTRVSVPSGKAQTYRWELETLEGSNAVEEITGIIVFQKQTRAFWPGEYEGGSSPPSCSSPDAKVGFGKQWATAQDPDPDGDPKQLQCASCPNAQFGSDGKRAQACKQTTQLFVLLETGFLPAVVSVPPTSLAAIKKYMLKLAGAGIRYDAVVTKFGLRKEANQDGTEYGQIVPSLAGRLSPEDGDKARAYAGMLRPVFDRATNNTPTPAAPAAPTEGDPS